MCLIELNTMTNQTFITLNDGNKIPQYGIGLFMVPEGPETINTVKTALDTGVRHIDTAHAYQNEHSVGVAVNVFEKKKKKLIIINLVISTYSLSDMTYFMNY